MSASPVLAVDRVRVELESQKAPVQGRTFSAGIRDVDNELSGVWTSGKVIGIASEKGSSLGELILGQHLLSFREGISPGSAHASAFVIAPHNLNVVTAIHSTLVGRLSCPAVTTAQLEAVQYLEWVQVLQYFDFPGLTESVAEVSARLFKMSTVFAPQKIVLYIKGLGVVIEDTQRRSGLVQANALLSSLLRTLIHLSRTYPCLLILLDIGLKKEARVGETFESAFASATGSDLRLQPGGPLGQTLEAGLDVLVLVHDRHGTVAVGSVIVEVVKDRVGAALGAWAVWKDR